jgi:CxxC-x17-CxxC domain-containing protein
MENHNDQHIVCADCGASFLFSAGEAAVFDQRGLAAPKRCKDCRRARKESRGADAGPPRQSRGFRAGNGQAAGGWNGGGHGGGMAPRGPRQGGDRPFAQRPPRGGNGVPRYTGDVNEYRSPMADGGWQQPRWQQQQPAARGNWQPPRAQRRGEPGIYRGNDEYRAPSGHIEGTGSMSQRPRRQGPPGRPQAEMFSITCDSCGAQAEVPFKPAEGREVFCQSCYRARKPAV